MHISKKWMSQRGWVVAGYEALEWVLGDAEQLPLASQSMDSYTIAFGIRNVTRIPKALEEARRVRQAPCLAFKGANICDIGASWPKFALHLACFEMMSAPSLVMGMLLCCRV